MRYVSVNEITKNVKEMCIEANHFLTEDMKKSLENAYLKEESDVELLSSYIRGVKSVVKNCFSLSSALSLLIMLCSS